MIGHNKVPKVPCFETNPLGYSELATCPDVCQGQRPQPPPLIVALACALLRGKTVEAALVVKMQASHATQTWLDDLFDRLLQSHVVTARLSKVHQTMQYGDELKLLQPSFCGDERMNIHKKVPPRRLKKMRSLSRMVYRLLYIQ